jgi:hypothetical protein
METLKQENVDEEKAVMLFTDANIKPMIVNSTNWDTLELSYGKDTDLWIGKPVEIYVDPGVSFSGRRVGGVRVRIPAGSNIQPVASLLTWEQAQQVAMNAGIDKPSLVAAMKAAGKTGYSPTKDTEFIRKLITDKISPPAPGEAKFDDDPPPTDESIPF